MFSKFNYIIFISIALIFVNTEIFVIYEHININRIIKFKIWLICQYYFRIASYHFMVICFTRIPTWTWENRKRKVSHYYCLYTDFHYDIHQYTRLIKNSTSQWGAALLYLLLRHNNVINVSICDMECNMTFTYCVTV